MDEGQGQEWTKMDIMDRNGHIFYGQNAEWTHTAGNVFLSLSIRPLNESPSCPFLSMMSIYVLVPVHFR